mgnify:CR=1 FL=1
MDILRRLHKSGEEVTITALAAAVEFDDEVTDLFLTGPMKSSEDLQRYFKGRGEIDTFLTAALGPEPTSHTAAFTYSQREVKVKDTWWASRQLSQRKTKPVRDPQADSKTSSELSNRYEQALRSKTWLRSKYRRTYIVTSIARNLRQLDTQRLPDEEKQ